MLLCYTCKREGGSFHLYFATTARKNLRIAYK